MLVNTEKQSFSSLSWSRLTMIWGLFFLICFSLGYPTLNRYLPNLAATTSENPHASLVDTKHYVSLVENGFEKTPDAIWRYRVLVPYVAKPFYALFKGHIGSWNPAFFSLLVANSLFVASTAVLLFLIGSSIAGSRTVGTLSSLLLLVHFNVSNLILAGLVDSGELFVLVLVTWLLFNKKWQILPFVGILAFLSRETTVVFMLGLASGWLIADVVRNGFQGLEFSSKFLYVGAAVAVGLSGLVLLRYVGTTMVIFPWEIGNSIGTINLSFMYNGFFGLMSSKALLYAFIWLLPLGLLGISTIPKNWLWASVLTTIGALVLIMTMHASENASRPLFNVAGPMLLVAAASFIAKVLKLDSSSCRQLSP